MKRNGRFLKAGIITASLVALNFGLTYFSVLPKTALWIIIGVLFLWEAWIEPVLGVEV